MGNVMMGRGLDQDWIAAGRLVMNRSWASASVRVGNGCS